MTVGVDGDLHRRRANVVLAVITDRRFDAGRATEGNTGASTVLDDDETLFILRQAWSGGAARHP